MKATIFPIFNRHGLDRILKTKPDLTRGEYCVAIEIEVPDSVFANPPMPRIEVSIPSPHIAAACISVDSESAGALGVDAVAQQQSIAMHQLGKLVESARLSRDSSLRQMAEDAVSAMMSSGIEVRLVLPEEEGEGQ